MSKIVAKSPDALKESKCRFGEAVYQARKKEGISQADLGSHLGVSEDTIASLEHGEFVNYDLACAAAQRYNLSLCNPFPPESSKPDEALLQSALDTLDLLSKAVECQRFEIRSLMRKLEQFQQS